MKKKPTKKNSRKPGNTKANQKLIVYSGEICLKGDNRELFEQKLIRNIKDVIKFNLGQDIKFNYQGYGYFVFDMNGCKIDNTELVWLLERIPGISNFIIAAEEIYSFKDLKAKSKKNAEEFLTRTAKPYLTKFLKNHTKKETFRITAKRHFKEFPITSHETNILLGNLVNDDYEVDLDHPDFEIVIAITEKGLYFADKVHKGSEGLPLGSSGKAVALLSGGIDSPVAAYLGMLRGLEIEFVHFQNKTILQTAVKDKVQRLVKQLAKFQASAKLYVVSFDELQKQIITKAPAEYRMIIYRRYMFKLAQMIAEKNKIDVLVSGDNLAQVASQTVSNLITVYNVLEKSKLLLTPLIGYNKVDIMSLSRKLGLYDISILPYGDCCSMLVAKHPKTSSKPEALDRIEEQLGIDEKMLKKLIDDAEIVGF